MQIWSQNPSGWRASVPKSKVVDDFRRGCLELDLNPVVIHGIYLMNFASPDNSNWEKAIEALILHLEVGALIGTGGGRSASGIRRNAFGGRSGSAVCYCDDPRA